MSLRAVPRCAAQSSAVPLAFAPPLCEERQTNRNALWANHNSTAAACAAAAAGFNGCPPAAQEPGALLGPRHRAAHTRSRVRPAPRALHSERASAHTRPVWSGLVWSDPRGSCGRSLASQPASLGAATRCTALPARCALGQLSRQVLQLRAQVRRTRLARRPARPPTTAVWRVCSIWAQRPDSVPIYSCASESECPVRFYAAPQRSHEPDARPCCSTVWYLPYCSSTLWSLYLPYLHLPYDPSRRLRLGSLRRAGTCSRYSATCSPCTPTFGSSWPPPKALTRWSQSQWRSLGASGRATARTRPTLNIRSGALSGLRAGGGRSCRLRRRRSALGQKDSRSKSSPK